MTNAPATRPSIPARQIAAVVAGNALEFYDFLTYAFFAVYIGKVFFPATNPSTSLLASLGTFGVGFVTRPIGSLVIGRMGDRLGRKPAMILTFSMMGVAITGLALTPPHSMIGVAAPILVIFLRMLQGFALGGEVGPTTAFLLEAAPPERRGFYTAFQAWTQHLSILVSGLVGLVLANTLNEQQLEAFGWRIAFLIGTLIVPFGIVVRRSLPETFHPADHSPSERAPLRPYLPIAAVGMMLLGSGTIGTYVTNYMTTYAIATLHMPAKIAFAPTVVVGLCGVVFDLMSGAVSDRAGRKLVMLVPGVLLLALILPAFHIISRYPTLGVLAGVTAVLAILLDFSVVPMITWFTESLPPAIRSSGVAVVYAFAIATFGGTTQYAVTWLINVTGNPLAPAWYWTAAALVGVVGMLFTRETAPRRNPLQEALVVQLPDTRA